MKFTIPVLPSLFILFSVNIFSQNADKLEQKISYHTLLHDFTTLSAVSVAGLLNNKITINQDAAVFHLKEGEVIKLSPVAGRECAYFFNGKGIFEFTPSTKVEKEQLFRFYETESINDEFDELLIITADSNFSKAFDHLKFSELENPRSYQFMLDKCLKYIVDIDKSYCDDEIILPFLENDYNNFFYSHIETEYYGLLFYEINPYEVELEEVKLFRKVGSRALIGKNYKEVINQFELSGKNPMTRKISNNAFQSILYEIYFDIDYSLDINAKCIEVIKRKIPGRNWLKQYLYSDLIVDSVYLDGEFYAGYHRGEDNYELWVELPDDPDPEREYSLTVYYSGEVMDKNEVGWIGLKSSLTWYPNYLSREYSMFDIIFSYPEKYTLLSIGEEVSFEKVEDYSKSRWKTKYPARNASFNLGVFENYKFENPDGIDVEVFISEAGHHEMARVLLNYYEIFSSGNPEEKIGSDVLVCTEFFSEIFGSIPLKKLHVTEIPFYHSQAFPGMVHLSWYNYHGTKYDGSDEKLRAHEVAHQWWGIGVDFLTYHDQWLSEGFAEYSALMFVQAGFNDNDLFFDMLKDWKDKIFNNRVYLFSKGQEAGPIWLGYRTSTSTTENDYNLIIYKKGAWVLHMMRNMLLDLNNMNENKFSVMMQDFFKSYYGKKASTEDFKRIADKHFGEDMSWFFSQYVYGTEVPTYNFSYKSEETEDGKYKITCKVIQEDVPDNFKMYIPIKIEFSDDRFARLRIEIKQKETILKMPLLPEEPEDIIFNDLESVLCKINYENWED